MLVSWNSKFVSDSNKIFKFGPTTLNFRFQKIADEVSAWIVVESDVHSTGCSTERYKPIEVAAFPGVVLIPNADIFNFNEIIEKYEFNVETDRKEEVIIHLYVKLGISAALSEIQGEYSFILVDKNKSYLVRDCSGTRGLCYLELSDSNGPVCAAFRASLLSSKTVEPTGQVHHVPAGSIIFRESGEVWKRRVYSDVYQQPLFQTVLSDKLECDMSSLSQMRQGVRNVIKQTIECRSRSYNGKLRVGLLLSGGLNSRLIGTVLKEMQIERVKTFFIGTRTSHERGSSASGARFLGSVHHDINLDTRTLFKKIPKLLELIETYDTASVRKGLLLYTVCNYIREKENIDILFCGEGLDDVAGSQIYFKQARSAEEFQMAVEANLKNPIGRDVFDKISSWFGIQIVFPFLDPLFTAHYLSFSSEDRMPRFGIEKYFLRSCFHHCDTITEEVLWKRREDWVDSASSFNASWVKYLQKICSHYVDDDLFARREELYAHNTPLTPEEFYYRKVFDTLFPQQYSLVPAIFRPGFQVGIDPSPRSWSIYPQHLCVDFLETVRMMV